MPNKSVSVKHLFENIVELPKSEWHGLPITGIASDSRKVKRGNVYVAVKGYQTDGHQYIEEAVKKGASLIVTQDPVRMNGFPVLQVPDTRKTLALLAGRFFGNPSHDLHLIGITGTNGKTTVAILIESILARAGVKCGLLGTMLYRWPGYERAAERTTPDSVELQQILNSMKEEEVQAAVMEVTSHALALHRVAGMRFDIVVFTNLSRDHLDFHASLEDYRTVKSELFGMMKSGGIAVVNGDDPAGRAMLEKATGKKVTLGFQNPAVDYRIDGMKRENDETRFTLSLGNHEFNFITALWGQFNVMNAATAAVVGLEMELDEEIIFEGLRSVKTVRGRMEGLVSSGKFRVIVDYAHTPDALQRVLKAAREFTSGRIIAVFGCGGERDRGKRSQMGEIAENSSDLVIITSDNPRREDPMLIIEDILEGIKNKDDVIVLADRAQAIHRALDEANAGDTVVLAGKGHETVQVIDTERKPFDDMAIAKKYLA